MTKPFRPVRTLAGNTLVMTIGDADVVPKLEQPLLVISATFHEQGRTGSPHDVAMATLRLQGRVFKLDKVLSETVSGDPGTETVEIVAEGTHVPTGTAVDAVQWLHLFDHGSLLTLGFARREAWDDVFPRMRAVHDGITLKTH